MTYKAKAGTYTKAVDGTIALNFGVSGGDYCSNQCPHKASGACYAMRINKLKPSVRVSGEKREAQGFARTCLDLANDIAKRRGRGDAIPFVRLSSFGSVPNRPLSPLEEQAFVHMLSMLPQDAPVHFPVETEQKRARFQALIDDAGLSIVVRVSTPSIKGAVRKASDGIATSTVWTKGETKRERIAQALAYAAPREHVTVCPAIASDAKCGDCTACAKPGHCVIYPQH